KAPSSSGLGRRPLKAVARVQIPSGLRERRGVPAESAGRLASLFVLGAQPPGPGPRGLRPPDPPPRSPCVGSVALGGGGRHSVVVTRRACRFARAGDPRRAAGVARGIRAAGPPRGPLAISVTDFTDPERTSHRAGGAGGTPTAGEVALERPRTVRGAVGRFTGVSREVRRRRRPSEAPLDGNAAGRARDGSREARCRRQVPRGPARWAAPSAAYCGTTSGVSVAPPPPPPSSPGSGVSSGVVGGGVVGSVVSGGGGVVVTGGGSVVVTGGCEVSGAGGGGAGRGGRDGSTG